MLFCSQQVGHHFTIIEGQTNNIYTILIGHQFWFYAAYSTRMQWRDANAFDGKSISPLTRHAAVGGVAAGAW